MFADAYFTEAKFAEAADFINAVVEAVIFKSV